jgi:hypothetical protein
MSRLKRRVEPWERRQRQPAPNDTLKLLTTAELKQALALTERGEVLPDGKVRHPEVYQEASPEEWQALERWKKLCSELLDHVEAAEELLDRMGDSYGWPLSRGV